MAQAKAGSDACHAAALLDDVVSALVLERLQQPDVRRRGFLLEGFPRRQKHVRPPPPPPLPPLSFFVKCMLFFFSVFFLPFFVKCMQACWVPCVFFSFLPFAWLFDSMFPQAAALRAITVSADTALETPNGSEALIRVSLC